MDHWGTETCLFASAKDEIGLLEIQVEGVTSAEPQENHDERYLVYDQHCYVHYWTHKGKTETN